MSVKIMSMIFDRYHGGGGEMLLALALADHAHDDGTNIFPSVKHLSEKTRQSERTIQYQLRKMEQSGWLILVADEKGGRNKTREYRINDCWIKGANIAPVLKGANHDIKGAIQNKKGAIAVAPESSITIIEPSIKEKINKKEKIDPIREELKEVTDQTFSDFIELRKAKKAPLTIRAIENIRKEAGKAGISLENALIECCARGWQSFKADWYHKQQAPPAYQTRQQLAHIAARSIFGNDNEEKLINGEVIEYESTTKQLG